MATSTCIKCGRSSFEMVENSPHGSNFKYMFVQCTSCGSVIGFTDYHNTGSQLEDLTKKLEDLTKKVDRIQSHQSQMISAINELIAAVDNNKPNTP